MKKIIFLFVSMVTFQACTSQIYVNPTTLDNMLKEQSFTFMAEKANATNQDVLNMANAIPTYSATQMMSIDYGYTLVVTKDSISAELPYFGRMYTNAYSSDKQGISFISRDFSLRKEKSAKGNDIIIIVLKDVNHIQQMNLEIYKNGKASLGIDAKDRQPISYDGYLIENEKVKK